MTNEASNTETTAAAAEQSAPAPKKAGKKQGKPASKKTSKTASKPTAKKEARPAGKKATTKEAKPASKRTATATTDSQPREGSKKAIVLDLLRHKDGATMAEIAKATDWQNHSIRGFISGNVSKKMGLKVESTKNESGERVYRIASK